MPVISRCGLRQAVAALMAAAVACLAFGAAAAVAGPANGGISAASNPLAGVQWGTYTRGFALGATHYAATGDEIRFGARVAAGLARAGIRAVHFVINTAQNGRGFTYQQYHGPNYDNAAVCRRRTQSGCVTLGIPPTTNVTDPRLGLPSATRAFARRYVDAYLWIGRPWLDNQSDPFDLSRALALARTTPF